MKYKNLKHFPYDFNVIKDLPYNRFIWYTIMSSKEFIIEGEHIQYSVSVDVYLRKKLT